MKRLISSLTACLLFIGLQVTYGQGLADIKFDKMEHVFGKIKQEAGPAICNFTFANSGKVPLVLASVNASCGCTSPEWSKEPVLPGKTGFIKVSYDSKTHPGAFSKTITVIANVPNSSRVLTISGDVIPKAKTIEEIYPTDLGKIRMKNNYMAFVKVKDNEIKTDTLHYYNPGTAPVKIGYKFLPPMITLKAVPEVIQSKAKGYFLVTIDGNKKSEYGDMYNRIYLLFNGKDSTNYFLTVSANIVEDFSKLNAADLAQAPKIDFDTKVFEFGEIPEGQKVEHIFKISNKGKSVLLIHSTKASCGCTIANPGSNLIKPGESTDLKVTFDSQGKPGMQNKTVTVISNDPNQNSVVLQITGTVKKKE